MVCAVAYGCQGRHYGAGAIVASPPAGESVAGAGRCGQFPVGRIKGHGLARRNHGSAICVEGHRVVIHSPSGIDGVIRRVAHDCRIYHLCASAVPRPPAREGVTGTRWYRQSPIGCGIGYGLACRIHRTALGVVGHRVGAPDPLGIERVICGIVNNCRIRNLHTGAALTGPPAGESVAGKCGCGKGFGGSVGRAISYIHTCWSHRSPFGIEGYRACDKGRRHCETVGVQRYCAILRKSPAVQSRAVPKGNVIVCHYGSHNGGSRPNSHRIAYLPEHIGRIGAAAQNNTAVFANNEGRGRYLKYPDRRRIVITIKCENWSC